MSGNTKTAPVLSKTESEQLLEGNQSQLVTVEVAGVAGLLVHRILAMRFSGVWKKELSNPDCRILRLKPLSSPPVASSTGNDSSNATAEKQKLAVKFVAQWIENGGADPEGANAVAYPKTRPGLETLSGLARFLEVRELANRVKLDLQTFVPQRPVPQRPVAHRPGKSAVPQRQRCQTCPAFEHPGTACNACFYCKEVGHWRNQCPKREQARLNSLEWERVRQEKAERARLWREDKERKEKARQERTRVYEEKTLRRGIRDGEVGVGADGKTKWRWEKGI